MEENRDYNEQEKAIKSSDTVQGKCPTCGGLLTYSPEDQMLACEYCGAKVEVDLTPVEVVENDFNECASNPDLQGDSETIVPEVVCGQCGAHTTFPENTTSFNCAFCGTPIVLKDSTHKRAWKPEYILPFKVGRKTCEERFRKWTSSLWFAPSDFTKSMTLQERLKGVYLPYWTYDADTLTYFRGERGVSRRVTENNNGRAVTKTVIDWYPAEGRVRHFFDDVLVPASSSLPNDIARVLTNWDRKNYVEYKEQFVHGFLMELYKKDFKDCYPDAKMLMEKHIDSLIKTEIGGNQQRVYQHQTTYSNVKFKHVLLPVWLSAYRYRNKAYVFAINGRTGQVFGQRPYSSVKVTLLIVAIIAFLIFLFKMFA